MKCDLGVNGLQTAISISKALPHTLKVLTKLMHQQSSCNTAELDIEAEDVLGKTLEQPTQHRM